MRDASAAQWILSLIVPVHAAGSITGDLLEEAERRGTAWFWVHVVRTTIALLWQRVVRLPASMIAIAALSWLPYMTVGLAFILAGAVVAPVLSVAATFLSDHTGVGLLDLTLSTSSVRRVLAMVSTWVLAPAIVGALIARGAHGREMPVITLTGLIWVAMPIVSPFVGFGVRAGGRALPLMLICLLAGAVRERRLTLSDPSAPLL